MHFQVMSTIIILPQTQCIYAILNSIFTLSNQNHTYKHIKSKTFYLRIPSNILILPNAPPNVASVMLLH